MCQLPGHVIRLISHEGRIALLDVGISQGSKLGAGLVHSRDVSGVGVPQMGESLSGVCDFHVQQT